ncbi:restriction endonuclease subunit S [Methanosarcina sp. Mfa9]|uniref:restriction endonuclease subunit S n=1 Tax=Methanosarcina sp. Mfa9 TaxID=3439063 RepID=UPI003F865085
MISNLKNVPSGWQKVRFDDIAEIVTDRVEKPSESGLKDYIGLEHLDTDNIKIKRYGSSKDVNATKFLCKKGDIIFGKRRSYLRKVAVSERDAVVSAHSMVLRPTGDKIHPDFLPCFMQSSIFWKTAHAISEGSMSPTIKWKTLAKQQFWIPSVPEQKKISELLWSIEDNIQKTEKLIETTETLKQGLLNELLTKGIGHTRFKDTELGRIPEEWEVESLKSITSKITKGTTPTTYGNSFVDEGINFIKVESIDEFGKFLPESFAYIDEDTNLMLSRSILQENDILFSIAGALGRVARVTQNTLPANTNQALAIIRINKENILHQYVQYYLSSNITQEYITRHSVKTAQANVSLTLLSKLPILIPSQDEQLKICAIIKKVEENLNSYILHLEKLKNLKKKLINKLILGKVRVWKI